MNKIILIALFATCSATMLAMDEPPAAADQARTSRKRKTAQHPPLRPAELAKELIENLKKARAAIGTAITEDQYYEGIRWRVLTDLTYTIIQITDGRTPTEGVRAAIANHALKVINKLADDIKGPLLLAIDRNFHTTIALLTRVDRAQRQLAAQAISQEEFDRRKQESLNFLEAVRAAVRDNSHISSVANNL